MPQLDSLSWFDQVFSSTLVFFAFYLVLAVFFLPAVVSIFKGRQKLQNFRQYIAEIYNVQLNLLMINTQQTLSILLLNNLFLISFYHQPVFLQDLQANLIKTCYASSEMLSVEEAQLTVLAAAVDAELEVADSTDDNNDNASIDWWHIDQLSAEDAEHLDGDVITEFTPFDFAEAAQLGFSTQDTLLSAVVEDQLLMSVLPAVNLEDVEETGLKAGVGIGTVFGALTVMGPHRRCFSTWHPKDVNKKWSTSMVAVSAAISDQWRMDYYKLTPQIRQNCGKQSMS